MNTQAWIQGVIAVVIAVVVFSAVLVPMVSDAQKASWTTETNENQLTYATTDMDSITIVVGTQKITVNGTDISLTSGNPTMFMTDTFTGYFNTSNNTGVIADLSTGTFNTVIPSGSTITLSNGTYTMVKPDTTEITGTYTGKITAITPTGDYGEYYGIATVINVDKTKEVIFATGGNLSNGSDTISVTVHCKGTLDNIKVLSAYDKTNSAVIDIDDIKVTWSGTAYTEIDDAHFQTTGNHSVTTEYTYDGSTYSITGNVPVIFAPMEYHVVGDDNAITMIVGVVPLLVAIGILIGCVGLFLTRKV